MGEKILDIIRFIEDYIIKIIYKRIKSLNVIIFNFIYTKTDVNDDAYCKTFGADFDSILTILSNKHSFKISNYYVDI